MVRSILTTPLNGAFGMGVIKRLWAEPRVERIALIFNPGTAPETYQSSIEGAARKLGTQVIKVPVGDAIDIVRGIDMFAIEPNGGLLLLPDNTMSAYRQM